ncbi:hypothetical protein J6590_085037 [Homalodisca vitripennis]|nr:hypothetical protein J6590_085037 [Homalodisca vitripennis]
MKNKKTFNHSNTSIDYMTATSSTTRHPHRPSSSKPLTLNPKCARSSIHLISSGRAFQRRQASTVKDLLKMMIDGLELIVSFKSRRGISSLPTALLVILENAASTSASLTGVNRSAFCCTEHVLDEMRQTAHCLKPSSITWCCFVAGPFPTQAVEESVFRIVGNARSTDPVR